MNLIAIDPGLRTGVAVFEKGTLVHCGLLRYDKSKVFAFGLKAIFEEIMPDTIVVEIPRIYDRKRWKGDPNDLILVAKVAGIAIGQAPMASSIEEIYPQQWKGQRPKDIDNDYTRGLLDINELQILHKEHIPKSYMHNVIDAIGIGLWKLERR